MLVLSPVIDGVLVGAAIICVVGGMVTGDLGMLAIGASGSLQVYLRQVDRRLRKLES